MEEINTLLKELSATHDQIKTLPGRLDTFAADLKTFRDEFDKHRKDALTRQTFSRAFRQPGQVSQDCAGFLAGMAVTLAHNAGQLAGLESAKRDRALGLAKDFLQRAPASPATPMTTTEIPLPSLYGNEVAELVSQYGSARRYGTVMPMGAQTMYLPKLATSPAFGLIAMSAVTTEKKPDVDLVTFTAAKWGGLVVVPTELDEDSMFDVGQFIARYAAREMAKIEDVVFWTADGTATYNSLAGFTKNVVNDSKVNTLAGGNTSFGDSVLKDWRAVRAVVDEAVLGTGAYYCHPTFEALLASFNTAGDKPYVANGINGASLDGFPIRWVNSLPAYSESANASTVFVLFGDPSWQYLATRGTFRFDASREVYFATDEIAIRALERFTIGKMATGCVSGLRTAAA